MALGLSKSEAGSLYDHYSGIFSAIFLQVSVVYDKIGAVCRRRLHRSDHRLCNSLSRQRDGIPKRKGPVSASAQNVHTSPGPVIVYCVVSFLIVGLRFTTYI
jgi:hypothetical protein